MQSTGEPMESAIRKRNKPHSRWIAQVQTGIQPFVGSDSELGRMLVREKIKCVISAARIGI